MEKLEELKRQIELLGLHEKQRNKLITEEWHRMREVDAEEGRLAAKAEERRITAEEKKAELEVEKLRLKLEAKRLTISKW